MSMSTSSADQLTSDSQQLLEYQPSSGITTECQHEEFTQEDGDSLAKELVLSQRKSIILASRLNEKKLLVTGAQVYAARGRHRELA